MEVTVHAGADGVGGVAETNLAAGTFHRAGEGHVFENVVGDGGMTSDRVVGVALDQDVLAVGGGSGGVWVAYFRRRILSGKFGEDDRERGHLPECGRNLCWGVGEQVGAILFGFFQR